MANLKTYGSVLQAGQSRIRQRICLKDSGGGKNSSYPTKLHIATYKIRTLKSPERLIRLEEKLSEVKWDILGLCETRLAGEKCTTLESGHVMYQNNKENNTHTGGVASNKQDNKTFSNQNEIRQSNLHSRENLPKIQPPNYTSVCTNFHGAR